VPLRQPKRSLMWFLQPRLARSVCRAIACGEFALAAPNLKGVVTKEESAAQVERFPVLKLAAEAGKSRQ
jgi:hypothetical protein